jgi:hypothetical protein
MPADEVTQRLYATTDAQVWAQEWCRIAREIQVSGGEVIDEGWMIGWFANAMGTAQNHLRRQTVSADQVLWECFRHFAHMDEANAAIHCAQVRYSPITFRLAEHLAPILETDWLAPHNHALLQGVVDHMGHYEEDPGR